MTFVLASILERLLGVDSGFLSRPGELSVDFHPRWPGGAVMTPYWNVFLGAVALAWIIYVYRRDGRSRPARIALGAMRAVLVAFVLFLLNIPVLTLSQSRVEPSVLAIMIDDSISMRVPDVSPEGAAAATNASTRMQAVTDLLMGEDQALVRELAKKHQVKFYRFNRDARSLGASVGTGDKINTNEGDAQVIAADPSVAKAVGEIKPEGQSTQVLRSALSVLEELQGQRIAGVVLLTDGRDSPAVPTAELYKILQSHGVKLYPVPVGSDQAPRNVDLVAINVQDSAFKDDIVSFKYTIRGTGLPAGQPVKVSLKEKKTGRPLLTAEGQPAEKIVNLSGDTPQEEELLFKPDQEGPLEIIAEAEKLPGEIDEDDNTRSAQVSVLDAKIQVLYVDGTPRWEYRYIKTEMIRDKSVRISCLLTSADPSFRQEADEPVPDFGGADPRTGGEFPGRIRRFPETLDEIMKYDVVLFGDVDPRQFTDGQLQLVADFVSKKGGGFGMIAGERWAPAAFENTPIEPILPVNIKQVPKFFDTEVAITDGFRPVLTREGETNSIFRFFADREVNARFIKNDLQPLFWYCPGTTAKPGVGEVLAEHPHDVGPDGRKAPILVLGRFGAGRTLFSAIDDSWRWRFYTGENVFDTYWVQQLRYLARSRKLGQRRIVFTTRRPMYELGNEVKLTLRVLDPILLQQLSGEIGVEVIDQTDRPVRTGRLLRLESQSDMYEMSFTADKLGRFSARLPLFTGESARQEIDFEVMVPRLELSQPQVDRTLLTRLADETLGQTVQLSEARVRLPQIIASAAREKPDNTSRPLWDAPLALGLFVLLLTTEWVLRKVYGML